MWVGMARSLLGQLADAIHPGPHRAAHGVQQVVQRRIVRQLAGAEGHVTVLWGGDDLIGRLKELAKTQTIHRPPTAERIAQEVELIQPGMGHPAGAPAPASAPATADAVVELPGGRLVIHVHVHLPRDPLTLG